MGRRIRAETFAFQARRGWKRWTPNASVAKIAQKAPIGTTQVMP
jgi:hypothetical protein